MNFLFANSNSIFDFTSGSSISMRLILEELSSLGHNVYVVNSSISESEEGHHKTIKIWEESLKDNVSKNKFINRFVYRKINVSLIRTRNWERSLLHSDEEENIFRESINVIKLFNIDYLIGWGNLLLEESIFKEAKKRKAKICFYLVNPSYLGKEIFLLEKADYVITDSEATKNLYKKQLKCPCRVISKSLETTCQKDNPGLSSLIPRNCLLVNPSLEKGLEPFLILSEYFRIQKKNIPFTCIDGRNLYSRDFNYINKKVLNEYRNIKVLPPIENIDEVFHNVKILLLFSIWHESGSRLILESYSRGIPVIGFDTGGNSELMKKYPDDIFEKPKLFLDKNNRLRIEKWEMGPIFNRIEYLLNNKKYYKEYSDKIKVENDSISVNKKFRLSLKLLVKDLNKL